MRKVDSEKSNSGVVGRFKWSLYFLWAAMLSLICPRRTSDNVHNRLLQRFAFLIEESEVPKGTWKRWGKGGWDKPNQSDCRIILNKIRQHVRIVPGKVEK